MTGPIQVFQRVEQKYLLDPEQRDALERILAPQLIPDRYGLQTVASVYYDTPDCSLVRASLHNPVYKEKLRMRSYGRAERDGMVFVELKKKFRGVVYKRRETMRLREAETFLQTGCCPRPLSQIMKEIGYFRAFHGVVPMAFIACERQAFFDPEGSGLRLTFDTGIRCRDEGLSLDGSPDGEEILPEVRVLMEAKARGAMPLWLAAALSDLRIFPVSFSKYGRYYREILSRRMSADRRRFHVA